MNLTVSRYDLTQTWIEVAKSIEATAANNAKYIFKSNLENNHPRGRNLKYLSNRLAI